MQQLLRIKGCAVIWTHPFMFLTYDGAFYSAGFIFV